jgi:hypothetical protein
VTWEEIRDESVGGYWWTLTTCAPGYDICYVAQRVGIEACNSWTWWFDAAGRQVGYESHSRTSSMCWMPEQCCGGAPQERYEYSCGHVTGTCDPAEVVHYPNDDTTTVSSGSGSTGGSGP